MRHPVFPAVLLWIGMVTVSCTAVQQSYSPSKKYSPRQLQEDFDIGWTIYRKNHPDLYWHTPKDTVDEKFARVRSSLTDSMTEPEFRLRLSYAVASIRCGHTSVLPSKLYSRYAKKVKEPSFPLQVKVWGRDSMVVLNNLAGDSSGIKRGTVVTAIDSISASVFIYQMKQYAFCDGFSEGFRELQVSSGFPQRFKSLYGLKKNYKINFIDSSGNEKQATLALYQPQRSDSVKNKLEPGNGVPKKPQPQKTISPSYGKFSIDSAGGFGILVLNNFSHHKVPRLINSSFRQIKSAGINSLVLDLRSNGGGKIDNSTLLTRYVVNRPFRVADSVWAKDLKLAYPRYIQNAWLYKYFRRLIATKKEDGHWHNQSTERRIYKPKKKNHFDGTLYVLTGGGTFSASALFLSKIYKQPNVVVVGEETGGGARGNSAVYIPVITLPNTGVKMRLPLFRLISDHEIPDNGRGILPAVEVIPDSWHIANGVDKKMERVKSLIRDAQK